MEPNYFTCTLGQAAALGLQQPHGTVNAFIDAQAQDRPDSPAVGFPQPGSTPEDEWTTLTFTFGDIKRGSEHVASRLLEDHRQTLSRRQTVGLLCPSTPEFLFTWLALMRLGHAVLLIAPQCQPQAIASLCKTCRADLLFYDKVYLEQAREAGRVSAEDDGGCLEVAGLPFPEKTQHTAFITNERDEDSPPTVAVKEDEVAYLHHTSGTSSGMPKPIPQSHRAGVGVLPSFPDGHKAATFTTTPLYHGGIADLFRAWTSGALIWLFPGTKVPITATTIVRCLDIAHREHEHGRSAQVKYFSSVPYVLQMLEADSRGLQYLQRMDIVGVGGAALPAEVGDRIVNNGVNLISRFGSAECGFLMSSHRNYEEDKEWQYLRVASGADKYVRFEPQSDEGLSELVVLPGWPHMAKRNREDGSFATADLFAPHSSIPNAWRYHSRADSQLTLITGKKFDPAPLEASVGTSELLDDVLIFGNGRPYPGALLFRAQQATQLKNEQLLEQIWPVVDKLNNGSQDHARIPKTMLVPMSVLTQPLEKSSKGTILRGAVEKRFQREIEDAYAQVDGIGDTADVPDDDLPSAIQEMVRSVVAKKVELTNTTDLFSYGVDSVAGMQIRNRLRRLLPQDTKQLPINVVEDCGNVEKLAEYVRRRRRGEEEANGSTQANEHQYMRQLVAEYSNFRESKDSIRHSNGHSGHDDGRDVVILTGATGALGAHILDQYRAKANVRKIYCLVRGADEHAARERVNKALVQRKLQPLSGIDGDGKVTVLQAQLGDGQLGLEKQVYDQLAREATIIMHVAWSVNFRMKLRSFVKDSIAGVTNLVSLALASPSPQPPRFAFCSSVASAMAYTDQDVVPEEIIEDPGAATELGYSQSKWVAEQICRKANAATSLRGRVSVFRVGQLAGDSKHGVWNIKEAWPMMLSAVKVTGSLPALADEKLDWLPVDIAAAALIEGADMSSKEGQTLVYHVLNDNEQPDWTDLLDWLQKKETFNVVSPAEWVEQLERALNEGSDHPSGQLLDHWKRAYGTESEGVEEKKAQSVTFSMSRTKEALPALRSIQPVSEAYFYKLWSWIVENM
ncbi:hypothetical protein LTR36_002202 [Oleoguttula mirabilis]|uniref:Carrier domain-containing protein n=1 Tax=Oleoguttula mirabilis TaxID=1507867 RepID=A0AAV9JLF3_9PEZI|nr:hypothetical protein LTR36_002202 [Oleoguttula mirabilis]